VLLLASATVVVVTATVGVAVVVVVVVAESLWTDSPIVSGSVFVVPSTEGLDGVAMSAMVRVVVVSRGK
jgi:hypothetical protein